MKKGEKMNNDLVLIGHISRDIVIDHLNQETKIVGGAVIYAASAIAQSGLNLTVISKLPKSEESLKKDLMSEKARWVIKNSQSMTSIRNHYLTADKERRDVVLLSKADSFTLSDIEDEESPIYYLAGLFVGEIPDTLIKPLALKGKVAIDAQGVLRESDENGNMLSRDWGNKKQLIPYITYLKVDAAEAQVLTGFSDNEKAIRQLGKWGAKEVMLTHNSQVMVLSGDKIYFAPYTNKNNSGRTGRGDTTFSSYLAWRKEHSIEEAIQYAATLCSIKMEKPGVFKGSPQDVIDRINRDKISE